MASGNLIRRLVVGLGNPGERYAQTRHNAGFMVLDRLAEVVGVGWALESRFRCVMGDWRDGGSSVLLAKPQTYMNLSGVSVQLIKDYYHLNPDQLLIVVDDADLPFGKLRLRPEGSSGGHHGLESIEKCLGTGTFPRLRVGIGPSGSRDRDIADFVLGAFSDDEWGRMRAIEQQAVRQILCWNREGIREAMNCYNGPVEGL